MKTKQEKPNRLQNNEARYEAEFLSRLILDAPKSKKDRRSYFRQLRDQADSNPSQTAKGEAEFFRSMICFVNA